MFLGQGQISLDCEVLFCSEHLVKGTMVTLDAVRYELLVVSGGLQGGGAIGGTPSANS